MRRRSAVAIAAAGVAALGGSVTIAAAGGADPTYREELALIGATREPDGVPVNLDATIYLPLAPGDAGRARSATRAPSPAPAVLLAHGYGGTKDSVAGQARHLARQGYVVLTYTARGFGASGGLVHLNSPQYEVRDGQRMLDYLVTRPEVARDAPGDPRVGVAGGSYGGALALLLAGTDRRVDAIVPSITWNDLRQALFPQFTTRPSALGTPAQVEPQGGPGVFKRSWAAALFGATAAGPPASGAPSGGASSGGAAPPGTADQQQLGLQTLRAACGRLAVELCLGYAETAQTGRPREELLDLLAASSPARVAGRITAPTLLIQGQSDALFPLSEADANARAIARGGTPVSVVWTAGGHDGGPDESERIRRLTTEFFDRRLRAASGDADGATDDRAFSVTVPDAVVSSADTNPAPQLRQAPEFPGLPGGQAARVATRRLPLAAPGGAGPAGGAGTAGAEARAGAPADGGAPADAGAGGGEQIAVSPPGAAPAALSSLPGVSGALGAIAGQAGAAGAQGGPAGGGGGAASSLGGLGSATLPGQAATFDTAPLAEPLTIVGTPRVTLRVRSTTRDATLFASVQDVAPDGTASLPRGLVSPLRLEDLSPEGREITVALPAVVHDVPAGHRLRVVVSSTDQAYAVPLDARGYRISLGGDGGLTVPQVPLTVSDDGGLRRLLVLACALLGLIVLVGVVAAVRRRRRRRLDVADPDLAGVPLAITGLGKAYSGGFRAVSDLTMRVEHGQVLGLLGPNGAGKTTTLRMLMGLIHPSEGELRVFGHRVVPGAAVLSRVGAFVEGPGFLPHLTGLANLRLYWEATGRPRDDAHLAEALEVAGLGDDVHRRVRTYSHGMKQRLGIAQAMLGLPELLVLDEPTNGLDPPQIREMREVLARYAASGRTVVVSSHLLSEVEQTCSHVAVMHEGRLIAHGPVSQLIEGATLVAVDVDDAVRAARIARAVPGVSEVAPTPTGLVLRADAAARAELVRTLATAGVRVDRVAPQRGLEQTFLALVGER